MNIKIFSVVVVVLACLTILAFGQPASAIQFTDTGKYVPDPDPMAWADYDKDGSFDCLTKQQGVFHNNNGTFTRVETSRGGSAWGDYDKDGDLDVLGSGQVGLNNNGVFTTVPISLVVSGTSFALGVDRCCWGDYDNDGDLDVAAVGWAGGFAAAIFRNDGGMFVDIGAPLIKKANGLQWIDYDKDGDLDLCQVGVDPSANYHLHIYRNDGGGVFTQVSTGLPDENIGCYSWGDYDSDGYPDVAIRTSTTKIYRNNRDGTFVDSSVTGPFASNPSIWMTWGDFDNDGYQDLAASTDTYTRIYRNNGSGAFTDPYPSIPVGGSSSFAVDFDRDGTLDLAIKTAGGAHHIFRSSGAPVNTAPTVPTGLSATASGASVTFSWNAAYDLPGPQESVTYNIRVGTTSGGSEIVSPSSNRLTGQLTVMGAGNVGANLSWTLKNCPGGPIYYSVQAVDGIYGSNWAYEKRIDLPRCKISGYVRYYGGGSITGASVLADNGVGTGTTNANGYYEVWVQPGWSGSITVSKPGYTFNPASREYVNVLMSQADQDFRGSGSFSGTSNDITDFRGPVAWGDYDSDGWLDLLGAGDYPINSQSGYASWFDVTRAYHNNNGVLTSANLGLTVSCYAGIAWGDYDNDGDIDLALDNRLYRNDGGAFTPVDAGLIGQYPAWGDYDNDGDLDLALSSSGTTTRLYHNDNGVLAYSGIQLAGSQLAWADFDNDGDLDLVSGSKIYINSGGAFSDTLLLPSGAWSPFVDYDSDGDLDAVGGDHIFRNDGGNFVDSGIGFPGVAMATRAWGDYDNDGDLDVALTLSDGYGGTPGASRVCRNDGAAFTLDPSYLAGVRSGGAAWGDYDNDGALDLAYAGFSFSAYHVGSFCFAGVYHNDSFNMPPNAPTGLKATSNDNVVAFSWSPGSDFSTPVAGLTYNLRVGTSPGKGDIMSGMALANGRRLIPAMGNVQKNLSWKLKNLPAGKYYWSVQSIDTAFAGSAWAPEQVFANVKSLSGAKNLSVGDSVICDSVVVTAVFGDSFYVENTDRSSGIRVDKPNHGLVLGKKIDLSGTIQVDTISGEPFIQAATITDAGTGSVAPLGMSTRALGGSASGLQGAVGSPTVKGLNNVGLLVKICGKVTQKDPSGQYFYLDDGSGVKDGATTDGEANIGVRVAANGSAYAKGQVLTITGISSCFKGSDGKLLRLVKVRELQPL